MKLRGIEEQSGRLVESLRNGGKYAVQGMITYHIETRAILRYAYGESVPFISLIYTGRFDVLITE